MAAVGRLKPSNHKVSKPTLCRNNSHLVKIFEPDKQDFGEGANHGEDHPDVDHLDVRGAGKCLTHPNETARVTSVTILSAMVEKNLQRGKNEHGCQVDLNHHVEILVRESVHHVTHKDQHCSGQSHL